MTATRTTNDPPPPPPLLRHQSRYTGIGPFEEFTERQQLATQGATQLLEHGWDNNIIQSMSTNEIIYNTNKINKAPIP